MQAAYPTWKVAEEEGRACRSSSLVREQREVAIAGEQG
jgi:hypothetical protein